MSFDSIAAILGVIAAVAGVSLTIVGEMLGQRTARGSLFAARRAMEKARAVPRDRMEAVEYAQEALERLKGIDLGDYTGTPEVRAAVDDTLRGIEAQQRRFMRGNSHSG